MMTLLPSTKPIDIEFQDLSYCLPTGRKNESKVILKEVSGKFRSGRLTAIMGPSGAGKTTLMNIIATYKLSHVEGEIYMNGQPRSVSLFRKSSCYIMQEDHHLPHLTVSEAMNISANLKLGDKMTRSKKEEVITEVLEALNLEECKDTRTSNLSGGQRKRLSIAVELVDNPPVMFFDEPTSGLDSQNSFQCIRLLKSLAMEGRTIVCTIHQPSARLFEKFDYLYALADGHCIYRGAVKGLLSFLSSQDLNCPSYHNPADFLIEAVSSGELTQKLRSAVESVVEDNKLDLSQEGKSNLNPPNKFLSPKEKKKHEKESFILKREREAKILISKPKEFSLSCPQWQKEGKSIFPISGFRQFWILLKRNNLYIMRDSMLTKMRILSYIIVAIMHGSLFFNVGNDASKIYGNSSFLFCTVFFKIFAGMLPTILTFPMEMKVLLREHHNRWYSLKVYYLAKTIADIPFQIFYPFLYTIIAYFMTSQPLEVSRFFMFTTICIMISLVGQSLALGIGAGLEIQEATFLAPVLTIPVLLFSGFFVTYSTMPIYLRWVTYLSYMRYGYEGIHLAMFGYGRENLECSEPYCHFRSPRKFLQERDIEGSFWTNFIVLCFFLFAFRALSYFVLRWKLKSFK